MLSFGAKFWLPATPVCVHAVCHAEELPLLFHPDLRIINASFSGPEAALSAHMEASWATFAKSAAPGTADGALPWPALDASREAAMRFSTEPGLSLDEARYREKCELWDGIGYDWALAI